MPRTVWIRIALVVLAALASAGCAPIAGPVSTATAPATAGPLVLRLATTTSTDDTGLLDAILPDFEAQTGARVDVIAVGTGQALKLGSNGDVDVVLVHARSREDQFVAAGDGVDRRDVMYNDFVVVGPASDPAGVAGASNAAAAFSQIAARQAPFVSRGDDSGTHTREQSVWASAGVTPTTDAGWYLSIGQGMGETLLFAAEKQAYTLSDRGTWLAMHDRLPGLAIVVGGANVAENPDAALLNPYGVIPVNPERHPGVNFELATRFADWITSLDTQRQIAEFGISTFGQPLFYPSSAAWKQANP